MKRKSLLFLLLLALLAPWAAFAGEVTIANGTATNSYVPMYTYYCDYGFTSEYIIPASELTNLPNGSEITAITLYQASSEAWVAKNLTIKLSNTTTASYSSNGLLGSSGTTVYTNSSYSANSASSHTFNFNGSSFTYTGGNLIVQISAASGGTYKSSTWYGVSQSTYQGYYVYGSASYAGSRQQFIPKTTITYTATTTLTVNVNNNTGGTVTGSNSNCDPTNWYLITATPSSGYRFLYWKENGSVVNSDAITYVNMSTDHTYTAFFEPIYTVSASANPAAGGTVALGTITYNFDDHTTQGWTNIDADGDHVIWELYSNGITYENGGGGSGNGHNSSADCMASGSFSNTFIEVYTPNNFLVSPKVQLGGSISFYARNANGTYPERIAVAVSTSGNTDPTDFTTIISSVVTLSGSSWTQYTVSLSDYSGAGYVAIRNYGTEDQLYLLVDDITIVPGSGTSVSGTFNSGQSCTATATANSGYTFINWTENNSQVSASTSYSTTVSANRNLVANFSAPIDVVVGTNEGTTNGSYLPVHFYYNNSLTQQIYKPSEIGYTGNIKQLSFYYSDGTSETRTIAIYMKMTTANTLSAFDSNPGTLVYSGSYTFSGTGWQNIPLSGNGFNYNDICENLMITVDMNGSYSGSRYFATYNTGENRALYKYDDSTNFDPTSPPSSPSTSQYNNYIKLVMENTTEYKILTAKSNDLTMGSFSLNPSGTNCSNNNYFAYDAGTTVTLTASATTGNTFVNWTVDGNTVTGSSITVTMNDHHTVVANFSENPVAVPYTENFESNTWKFVNGSRTNKWYRGAAGAHTGSYGLFVSNDGTNNTYDGGSASAVWAYKTLSFDESTDYIISFDWKAVGESSYDYIRVGLVPASTTLVDGESFSAPTGWIDLNNNTYLNQQSSWQTKTTTINVTAGTYKLAFCWRNDTSVGYDPPAAIDNVVVKKSTHTLTASVSPANSGTISANGTTISGATTYNHGTSVTLTPTPATGYDFVNWTVDGTTQTGNTYTVTMDQDHTVVANFQLQSFTVTVLAEEGGTATGGGNYNYGATANIEAIPDACHTFSHFVDDNNAPIYGFNPLSIGVDHDMTITAVFNTITYAISATAYDDTNNTTGGGTVSGDGTLDCGSTCTLVATPATNYVFDNWTENGTVVMDNGSPAGASYSFTVSGARTLVAHFHLDAVSISATAYDDSNNAAGGGTISGTGNIAIGTTCNLVATPGTGYEFVRWTENGSEVSTNATYSFTVSVARTLVAHFRLMDYTLTLAANPQAGGTVSANPAGPYHYNDVVTISATAATGYTFTSWSDNGTQSHTVTINGNDSYTANFSLNQHTVTYAYTGTVPTGAPAVPAQATYYYGDAVPAAAVPTLAGYTFSGWVGEVSTMPDNDVNVTGSWTANDYTLTLTADPNNGGTVSANPANQYYHYGDVVTITATPNSGYTFGSWSDSGAQSHDVTITGDASYTAYFGADHTLATYATPMEGGYVTIAPVSNINAVTVGNGTDHNNVSPFTSNNAYSFEECIYTASEINLPLGCTITSISYECTNGTSQSNHIEVFMKLVNYATFSGATTNPAYEEVTDNDKVFDGIWTITAPASSAKPDAIWNTIILDKPFVYDGTSNLMIGIHESTAGIAGGVDFSYSTVSNSSAICFSSDNKPNDMVPTDINDLKNGTLHERSKSSLRANVRLGFGTYHNGQSVTLTAHPNAGYQFVNWTENNQQVGTAGNATYTVTMDTDHTIYAHFERALKRFVTDGYWNVAGNWDPVGVPTPDISEDISIEAHAIIPDGVVAYADSIRPITHANSSITIKDGGQLVHNSAGLSLTAEKDITGYTIDSAQTNWNYYLFSSPVIASATYSGIETTPHYDLYSFDASNDPLEWILSTPSDIAPYTGFIYASRTTTTITVSGTVPPSNTTPSHQLDYTSGRFIGWNLIGNPFVCNAYVTRSGNNIDYYVLNHQSNYDEFIARSSSDTIVPLGALMVKASASGQSVTYSRSKSSKGPGILNIDVRRTMERGSALLDRARVRFGEGDGLEKFQFNPNHTKVYIPDGDKDFAVYYAQGSGTIPVNFKAENNGRYTLNFSTEDVGFNYIHLIDNMNGNDVDLLKTPYYSFDARSTDYASRFTIVFATGDSNDGNFAFYNNGLWIINNDGEATLQVVDALGRILSSETISGSCSKAINAAPGVYMLRLINGNDVKVQKIVVRR